MKQPVIYSMVCLLAILVLLPYVTVLAKSQVETGRSKQISWRRAFDDEGRLVKLIDPAGGETHFQYSSRSDGKVQVTKKPPEGSEVIWQYDEQGRLRSMTDGMGTTVYRYDDFGRLMRIQREGKPGISYTYDTQDRMTRLRVGDFYSIDYHYDFLDRLASMDTPAGKIKYEYQTGQGLVIRTLPNGVKTIWEYGVNGQLRKITHADVHNMILAEYIYEYRADGLISAIGERSTGRQFVINYEYDKVGRLIRARDRSAGTYEYEYDELGNRLRAETPGDSRICTYDWVGRITSLNGQPVEHDAVGNVSVIAIDGEPIKYRYNSDGQLTGVGESVSYKYDGDGRLTLRIVNGKKTAFISNPLSEFWQPLVMNSNTDRQTLIVWDHNTPLIVIREGSSEYMLHDHLGSLRLVVDGRGKVKQRVDYDPFGVIRDVTDPVQFEPRFAGLFWDARAHGYLTLACAYVPTVGLFLGPEPEKNLPFGSHQSLANYVYCDGDPMNFIDRSGLTPEHFGSSRLWWSAFWDDLSHHFLDPRRAKNTLAMYSDSHLRNARGLGIAAGLTATTLDVIGGYIPGEGGNRGQAYASIGWSLALGGFKSLSHGLSTALRTIGTTRTASSAAINVFQGDVKGALIDAISLGGGSLGAKAERIFSGAYSTPVGQFEFNFLSPRMIRTAERLQTGSNTIEVLGYYQNAVQTWQVGMKNWSKATIDVPIIDIDQAGSRSDLNMSRMSPSTVGGVYLGGAGQALEGLGQIEGLALNANQNLILLSQAGEKIDLPPLRLDDLVTVFRSVYIHGEGPTVTIDPNPRNPSGSAMIIQHGKATEDTYVGWVLYQADRLMKGYTLGVDNISSEQVTSAVPGYDDVLDAIYFGGGGLKTSRQGGHWERFWIVKAGSHRFESASHDLTLFDVPLKVKTQVMKWQNGELVDDLDGQSSIGAIKFTQWFTTQYDLLAEEQYLMPPPESGMTQAVPVFIELRRIALMTALAEKLRDQGTPMPFWMRDYEVQPVPFERFTPGMQVSRSDGNVKAQIFGGVTLSPETRIVKQFSAVPDLEGLPQSERSHGEKILKRVNALSGIVQEAVRNTEPLELQRIDLGDRSYHVTAMPGHETQALAPCRLQEVDLSIPVEGGRTIQLVRNYHSFFNPSGDWGKGWTMNLPRLDTVRIPIERKNDAVRFRTAYELLTPLNSVYARFSEVKEVPVLDTQLQVPDENPAFFGIANSTPDFLTIPTLKLLLKNGEVWHFTEAGDLAAIEKNGFRTIYERGIDGNVSRIVGVLGTTLMASIKLCFDEQSRLVEATGHNLEAEKTIRYEYNASGRLIGIIFNSGKLAYQYRDHLVTAITWQDFDADTTEGSDEQIQRRFVYNNRGQLIAEMDEKGERVTYKVSTGSDGHTMTMNLPSETSGSELLRYDETFRPVLAQHRDGTQTIWTYPDSGGRAIQFKGVDGSVMRITESADQRYRVFEAPNRPLITKAYDEAGHLVSVNENGRNVLRQRWSAFGNLEAIEIENRITRFQYNEDGLMTSVVYVPNGDEREPNYWQKKVLDFAGRPVEITDFSGLHTAIQYDATGEVAQVITKRDGKNYGYAVYRNEDGLIREVQSSWGKQNYDYDANGELKTFTMEKNIRDRVGQAILEFESGRLRHVRQFDGGEMSIAYHNEAAIAHLPDEVKLANGLQLDYDHDSSGNLSGVTMGNSRRITLEYDEMGRVVGYTYLPQGNEK